MRRVGTLQWKPIRLSNSLGWGWAGSRLLDTRAEVLVVVGANITTTMQEAIVRCDGLVTETGAFSYTRAAILTYLEASSRGYLAITGQDVRTGDTVCSVEIVLSVCRQLSICWAGIASTIIEGVTARRGTLCSWGIGRISRRYGTNFDGTLNLWCSLVYTACALVGVTDFGSRIVRHTGTRAKAIAYGNASLEIWYIIDGAKVIATCVRGVGVVTTIDLVAVYLRTIWCRSAKFGGLIDVFDGAIYVSSARQNRVAHAFVGVTDFLDPIVGYAGTLAGTDVNTVLQSRYVVDRR